MNVVQISQPLRTSRTFAALWGGQLLSRLGDEVFIIILPLVVYSLTGSVSALSLLMVLRAIPQIVLQPFTGVLVDRFPRVTMMLASDSMRFILLIIMAVLGVVHRLTIVSLDITVLVYGAVSVLFRPAYMAFRKQIFTPEIRNAAISLTQIGSQVTSLVGPSLGGLIMTLASPVVGFIFDAATFVFSLISLLSIRKTDTALAKRFPKSENLTFAQELLVGYRESARHPWIWVGIISWTFIISSYSGIIPILLPWLIKVHLRYPDYAYGLLVSMSGIGAIVAGLVAGSVRNWSHRGVVSYGAVAVQGLALLGIPLVPWLPGLMILMTIGAAGSMLFGIIHEGILQELVADEYFGRVISFEVLCASLAQPLGYVLTGTLFRTIGGISTIIIEAAGMFLTAMLTLCVPSIRKYE